MSSRYERTEGQLPPSRGQAGKLSAYTFMPDQNESEDLWSQVYTIQLRTCFPALPVSLCHGIRLRLEAQVRIEESRTFWSRFLCMSYCQPVVQFRICGRLTYTRGF